MARVLIVDDSPTEMYKLAAMLEKKAVDVPKTSSVPMDKLHEGGRKPLIQVTLAPGTYTVTVSVAPSAVIVVMVDIVITRGNDVNRDSSPRPV